MTQQVDYDYQPEGAGSGKFLNLKAKGDKILIRLADKPIAYFVHWVDGKTQPCEDAAACEICKKLNALPEEEQKKQEVSKQRRRQTFIWPAIDRADGEAKVYKAGISVFLEIAKIAKNPKWGGPDKDATKFDIEIERTEASLQNFYSVIPDPTSLSVPLTSEEKNKVHKLATLIDSIAILAVQSEEVTDVEKPSTENPANPDDFIKGLEEDQKKEDLAEQFAKE